MTRPLDAREIVVYEGTDTFIQWMIVQQIEFELSREGTDGSLFDVWDLEALATEGLQEEVDEYVEAIRSGDIELAQKEAIDIVIRVFSLLAHLGMDDREVMSRAMQKMSERSFKYPPSKSDSLTVKEAMRRDKQLYEKGGYGAMAAD